MASRCSCRRASVRERPGTVSTTARAATFPTPRRELFDVAPGGAPVDLFTFSNTHGVEVRVITWGGIIQSLRTPDRRGRLADIVLGHDDIAGYEHSAAYLGALIGRYANRIAGGRYTLDGSTHQLSINNGPNQLHGGARGFDKAVWEATPFERGDARGVILTHVSPDDDQGYPGTLRARVTYTLSDNDALSVDYYATTNRPTPVNLTQHSYFNLGAGPPSDVLNHQLTIHASRFTPVDQTLIPTGALSPVADTPFDFRTPVLIGARIGADDEQLRVGGGYDHNFVLDREGDGVVHAARLSEPSSGRTLDVSTTEPGMQFYSGNFLDGSGRGKGGRVHAHRSGLCLETQHFPDSPNRPDFPSTVLRPGAEYRSRTVFTFGVTDADQA